MYPFWQQSPLIKALRLYFYNEPFHSVYIGICHTHLASVMMLTVFLMRI